MPRSLVNAKLFSAFVVDGISNTVTGRGYAVASQGVVSSAARGEVGRSGAAMMKKTGEETIGSAEKVAWVPDPVTGCYKPENRLQEIDVAEQRAALLNRKY